MEPTEVIDRFAALLADGNVRDALALYEPGAAFVVEPGTVVVGHAEIGAALEGLAALRPALHGEVEQVAYAGDLALVANRWTLEGTTPDGEAVRLGGRSADVLRRQGSGEWRIAIDDPWGGGQ